MVLNGTQPGRSLSGTQWQSAALSGTYLPTIMPFKRHVGIHTCGGGAVVSTCMLEERHVGIHTYAKVNLRRNRD